MNLKKQLEVLRFLRDNKQNPTKEDIALMEILGFCYGKGEGFDDPDWYIEEDVTNEIDASQLTSANAEIERLKALLQTDVLNILTYFKNGLDDVEEGSGEKQPMQDEINDAIGKIQNLKSKNV